MKELCWLAVMVIVAFLGGCIPERVVWSPDGTQAAVLGGDGLHVCDPNGKLSPMLVADVSAVDWFPDSRRIAVIRLLDLKNWKQVESVFPEDAKNAVANSPAALKTVLAFHGNWDQLGSSLSSDVAAQVTRNDQLDAIYTLLYVREHNSDQIKAVYGDHWQAFEDLTFQVRVAQVLDLANPAAVGEGIIMRAATSSGGDNLLALRVSPNGKAVAITIGDWQSRSYMLAIADPQAPGENLVLGFGAAYPDWTPDGNTLVFIRAEDQSKPLGNSEQVQFGTLSERAIFDEKGELFPSDDKLPPTRDLAGMAYDGSERVRMAKDGRIFFSTSEVTLPATAKDIAGRANIFFLDPGKQSVVTRVIPAWDRVVTESWRFCVVLRGEPGWGSHCDPISGWAGIDAGGGDGRCHTRGHAKRRLEQAQRRTPGARPDERADLALGERAHLCAAQRGWFKVGGRELYARRKGTWP